ncbi:lactonase family protein [Novipirellula artificiosorum]|uniref:6-phosphogluconolactonase n=1 Tax=Novipirellula artificiosorum TaxID=2528016 RepID=A0A5C6D462_9BACT|nr:lactonase family protein [Novipirellula artificiosorum]TWU30571.1 6-phosphogluconolactonase [Novipirellula artificiosorum]
MNRRVFFGTLAASMLMSAIPLTASAQSSDRSRVDVWIGTSSAKPSKGIYHCTLDTQNGKLSDSRLVAEIDGPGFLAMHPHKEVLYAVGALDRIPVVAAYKVVGRGAEASLELLNSIPIGDGGAAHVSVDSQGKMLLTAQYGSGSVAAFSLAPDGSIQKRTALMKHEGGSQIVPKRQDKPHAHWTGFSPDERFAFVPDLGLDKVMIYEVDLNQATLKAHGFGQAPLGGGPRHMKFHPNGKWIFVLNELELSVTVFDYDAENGTMTPKQTIPTVSKSNLAKEAFKSASEIRIHPNGEFVYSANRGHDTITVFAVDSQTGELSVVEIENVRGATPRNFNLDPSGNWLLAAGQDSHTLASFVVDPESGELAYNQSIIQVPSPICVLFGR